MKLQDKIKLKNKELQLLLNQQKRNNNRMAKRWSGKFVNDNIKGSFINPVPTALGLKELSKYKIEFLPEPLEECGEFMWENPGISYTPKKCFCMICGVTNTTSWLQYGISPRFATCPRHADFIHMGFHIRKLKKLK